MCASVAGDYGKQRVYDVSLMDMARRYAEAGVKRLHLVDLDGAKASHPCNLASLREIASLGLPDVEWGGGIKSREHLEEVFAVRCRTRHHRESCRKESGIV